MGRFYCVSNLAEMLGNIGSPLYVSKIPTAKGDEYISKPSQIHITRYTVSVPLTKSDACKEEGTGRGHRGSAP